jgi:uncharacterized membrane protein
MATPKQPRTQGAAGRPGGGKATRDKGTRGGRPEPQPTVTSGRPTGNGQQRAGQQRRPAGQTAADRAGRGAATAVPAEPETRAVPSWFWITTWVLAAAGLGVSIYLTIAHYNTAVVLACPATSHINCERVTTSAQSVVFGIPVAVLGLAFYVFMLAATSPWAWRAKLPALRWARLGSVIVGMVFVLYLIYTEVVTLNLTICLWCTSVHVITFVLFALTMFAYAAGYGTAQPPERR